MDLVSGGSTARSRRITSSLSQSHEITFCTFDFIVVLPQTDVDLGSRKDAQGKAHSLPAKGTPKFKEVSRACKSDSLTGWTSKVNWCFSSDGGLIPSTLSSNALLALNKGKQSKT
jgi:hypothetical protein